MMVAAELRPDRASCVAFGKSQLSRSIILRQAIHEQHLLCISVGSSALHSPQAKVLVQS